MDIKVLNIYHMLYDNFLDNYWLNKNSLDSTIIKNYLESNSFKDKLSNIVEHKIFSCQDIFFLVQDLLSNLFKQTKSNDFLQEAYYYTLNKAFPNYENQKLFNSSSEIYEVYLRFLSFFSEIQKSNPDGTWQSKYPLIFLEDREREYLESKEEYDKFCSAFKDENIYEIMKLNQEVLGYNTLDHICGVHYLSLFISRQLFNLNIPIDLGRVSGAAAGHDIGKYGCKGSELKRVPYLHYYYTDQWFKKHDITYIGHIALNHSTWDLELENLPIESLVLIYSDFRVKNKTINNETKMHIYTLDESFDVILNKLDNVDDAKEKRYRRVYAKLKDFEDYLINLGLSVDIQAGNFLKSNEKIDFSLLHGKKIINNIKYIAINHNINLMHMLRDENSLNSILELARSETDLNKLREYLNIFQEYSTYLTQKQKLITIKFLYELLIHPEGDIRRQCAELIGLLIATFDEDYRKEIPEDAIMPLSEISSSDLLNKYMTLFLSPDHKIIDRHKEWIGYSTCHMVSSLFSHSREKQKNSYKTIIFNYFTPSSLDSDTTLFLLEIAKKIPINDNDDLNINLLNFIVCNINNENQTIRLSALELSLNIIKHSEIYTFKNLMKEMLTNQTIRSKLPSENYLKYKLAQILDLEEEILNKFSSFYHKDLKKSSDIFLSNLKTATEWIVKKIQIKLLVEHTLDNPEENGFYSAMHFCNLLKVSASETVRNKAGKALTQIIPYLSFEQRNDVCIELLRALEIEGYQFTKFIPQYLGQLILYLKPIELDEFIDDLSIKTKQANPQLNSLLLKTVGITIINYPKYKNIFKERNKEYNRRLIKLLGILLNGLANFNTQIKQLSFSVIGKEIFGSRALTIEHKKLIFTLVAKKILTLMTDHFEDELLFLTNSAGLNNIYRFISDYIFFFGDINIKPPKKIAFFPGTFDPFSLSHKQIAKAIRDLGFEVYLAVDEFSWSKQTLPNLLRRNIINMSVSDELNIYLYPENYPVNISNEMDLKNLRDKFPKSEIYVVVGSDVLINASAYKKQNNSPEIYNFNHIIFERRTSSLCYSEEDLNKAINSIKGKVIKLSLPTQYEDISSTQIRNYIDENRDISSLVDALVQKYIYQFGFYRREPQLKAVLEEFSFKTDVVEEFDDAIMEKLYSLFILDKTYLNNRFRDFLSKDSPRIIIIKNIKDDSILGFSAFHWVRSNSLFKEFKDSVLCDYIRENAIGRIICIDGIYVASKNKHINVEQILLTETLSLCLSKDYDYAVYKNIIDKYNSQEIYEILELQGFIKLSCIDCQTPVYAVNMNNPCTLNLDIDSIIKEPFKNNEKIKNAILLSRKRLQKALTLLYPGNLVLSFDKDILYQSLITIICNENNVPIRQIVPKQLGNAMCVPFGNILSRCVIPNTVTKSLHTEKLYQADLKSFEIGPYPYYLDLKTQIKMIKSFRRPIILVDDILHKGYRIKALDPLLKIENIEVQKIIVGILSGRGKELMDLQNRQVDSVYYIPKLKVWFNENNLYPFIGGDTLWRDKSPQRNLIPSINLILPYASPLYISGASKQALYNLSKTCLENAMDILTVIENEYQAMKERNFTLAFLGEVFIYPRCPDHGKDINYDLNLSPSHYLKNDMELLKRLENILNK